MEQSLPHISESVVALRYFFENVLGPKPIPSDVHVRDVNLGYTPALEITMADIEANGTLLWIHGGAFVAGSARSAIAPAINIARYSGLRVLSVDYRLAPEHPYPSALEDVIAAYRNLLNTTESRSVVFGSESAGGALMFALLVASRDAGLPLPAAAVAFSPASDLTMSGDSYVTKAQVDRVIDPVLLAEAFAAYANDTRLDDPLMSPLFADLQGLPPLLIQVGSHEVLLDDATRIVARLAAADCSVALEVFPAMSHVFQARADEPTSAVALQNAARFLARHLL